LTQPAISKRLKSLQQELGTKLYQRTGRGIELTEAGRSFLKKLEPILNQIAELKETCDGKIPEEKKTKVLYIAAAFSMAANLLPSIIRRFERLHADLQVDCQTGSSQQIQQLILEGRAEIGLSTYRSLNSDIVSEPFRVQSLVFFVKRRHALAKRRRISLKDVLAYPLVTRAMMGAPTWAQDVLKELSDRGYKPRIALRCNGPLQVKERSAGVSAWDSLIWIISEENRRVAGSWFSKAPIFNSTLSVIFSSARNASCLRWLTSFSDCYARRAKFQWKKSSTSLGC
jgi:DNA-binding transcriptional LysR family regulator